MAGTNRTAVDGTLHALRESGRLSDEHAALVALAQSLADAVDEAPGNASLWREYRGAVADLSRLAAAGESDALKDLVDRVRAPMGDAKD